MPLGKMKLRISREALYILKEDSPDHDVEWFEKRFEPEIITAPRWDFINGGWVSRDEQDNASLYDYAMYEAIEMWDPNSGDTHMKLMFYRASQLLLIPSGPS